MFAARRREAGERMIHRLLGVLPVRIGNPLTSIAEGLLHAQTARILRWALLERKDIIVTDVPYHLRD